MGEVFYIVLNLLGAGMCAVAPIYWLRRYGTSAVALHPIVLFSVYFGLIHFILPLYKLMSGNYRYPYDYSDIVLVYNAVISVFVYVLIAILLGDPVQRNAVSQDREKARDATVALCAGIILAALGVFSMHMVSGQIMSMGVEAFYSDRILMSANIGLFTRLDTLALPGLTLILAGLLNQQIRRPFYFLLFIGGFVYALKYYALIQSRNSMILLCVLCVATYSFYRNKPLNSSVKGYRNIAFIALVVVGFVVLSYNATVMRYAGLDSWFAEYALKNIIFILLDGPFGNDENLLWLLEYGHPYYWGHTYLAGITNLVPRELWPDKPWGAGPEIRNLIYPGSYVLGGEGNSSITTGFLTEAQMNFGFIGILAVTIAWVLVVRRAVVSLLCAESVFRQSLIIFTLCFLTTAFVHSEFLGFFGRYFTCVIAAVLVYVFLSAMSSGFKK